MLQVATIEKLTKPTDNVISVPGSKSYSLRAILISLLADEKFEITNLLDSDDVSAMKSCTAALHEGESKLFAAESGLTARFISAASCIFPGIQTIDGAEGLKKRPIKDLVDALVSLGAEIEYLQADGFLPIKITSSKLSGNKVNLSGKISSQYLSALLLIAPSLENGLEINIKDEQISKPYIDMTLGIMAHFGVSVKNKDYKQYFINPQKYRAREYSVEGDYSSAGYFFTIAALNKSKITVENLNPKSKQADINFLPILAKMGAVIARNENSITVTGSNLKPIEIDMSDCPDQAMSLAVLAAFTQGETTIKGVRSLRIKETERVQALQNELAKMGIKTDSTHDSLKIYGNNPKATRIDSYGDHRIAMSFAVAATKMNNLEIFNPSVVNKTFPNFWRELSKITNLKISDVTHKKIAIIGMRGTGKSTVGKIVAKKLGYDFVDVDDFIETKNKLNIKKTVQINGWEYFRDLETEAIKYLTSKEKTVISTGGGAILRPQNVHELRNNSLVFMLKANPTALAKRISRYNKLPALTKYSSVEQELKQVWADRKEKYFSSCDFIIDSEKASPKSVANQIIAKIS